ncbi:ketopantoate reductase family protein [Candidatus Protofrankia californiensis]|uniref:ketopantoate reductase family protein n=1 Tax=Candidatus Protofrankia californiensis TaxID=1839754 RepID=UPI001040F77A|nr:2-dehydropantoate 2-reductase N-terminal domain-containing protein [Candidatus Protofrankia californiensis]
MRIVVFGSGAIGTLHAWALSRAGHDVSMLVRPEQLTRWSDGIGLRILDVRGRRRREVAERFRPRVVTELRPTDGVNLVVLAVRHTQTPDVLPALARNLGSAVVLFLNNNWRGLDFIDAYLGKDQYVLGAPRAGGGIIDNVLDGALEGGIMLGSSVSGHTLYSPVTDTAEQNLGRLVALFAEAGFRPEIHPNMEHWLWVHFASISAWICGAARACGFESFTRSNRAVYDALHAGREAMQICAVRGADVRTAQDARPFLLPPSTITPAVRLMLRGELPQRISVNHGRYAPVDLYEIYDDLVRTGERLDVPMPSLLSYRGDVERMVELAPSL